MPLIGFGTFTGSKNREDAYSATLHALKVGYRHIDTAQLYGTEKFVGKAIKDSGVPREEIFLNTKIYNSCYSPKLVKLQLEKSLENLGVDYLDSWLMHTPWAYLPEFPDKPASRFALNPETKQPMENKEYDLLETWNVISSLVKEGYVRDAGVSNFSPDLVDFLLENGDIKPSVNQVEAHPYLTNEELRKHHERVGVAMTAYGPLGGPGETSKVNGYTLLDHPLVQKVAQKYKKSPGQILLKFQVQRGVATIPKSVTPARIESNIDIFDFEIAKSDLADLMSLNGPHRAYKFDRAAAAKPKHGPHEMFPDMK